MPVLMASTTLSSISTPTTSEPAGASMIASGSPTYPVPITTIFLANFVYLFLPFDSPRDAFLQGYRGLVPEVAYGFGGVYLFNQRRIRLRIAVFDQTVVFPQVFQYDVGGIFHIVQLAAGDIIHLARLKVIDNICQRIHRIVDIGGGTFMFRVHG